MDQIDRAFGVLDEYGVKDNKELAGELTVAAAEFRYLAEDLDALGEPAPNLQMTSRLLKDSLLAYEEAFDAASTGIYEESQSQVEMAIKLTGDAHGGCKRGTGTMPTLMIGEH